MFQKTVLDNGIRVVTEKHTQSRAVTTGFWIETGTRDERGAEAGLSHFIEHLIFKGTKKRSALRIARDLEAVGGDINAYTTQEYTCFHATTLKEDLDLQIDVLSDILLNSTFKTDEIERERTVVLQEIAMTADQPEEYVFDIFFDEIFGDSYLGRPILGTTNSVQKFSRKSILDYYSKRYTNSNLIISAAGGLDHEAFVERVEKQLGSFKRKLDKRVRRKPQFSGFHKAITRDTEQMQVVVGLPAATFKDELRFEAFIVNSLVGGGMTSKLYQSIREKKGLAYSVYSQLTTFTDTGVLCVYAATDPKQTYEVVKLIYKGLEQIRRSKISASDLKLFKTQVRGGLLLGADDVDNRMNSLGVNEMTFGEYRSVDRVIEDLDKVSIKSISRYIEQYMDTHSRSSLLLMGPENKKLNEKAFNVASKW